MDQSESRSNPPSPSSASTESEELDLVGAKVIELYQNHASLVDRIWAYFSQYSALLIVLGCLLAVFRRSEAIASLPVLTLMFPLGIYWVLVVGNHRALKLTTRELEIVRGIAVTRTRYRFTGSPPGTMMRFHLVLILLVSAWYLIACFQS